MHACPRSPSAVPVSTRDELSARAARSGRSLQEYLCKHLIDLADRPDPELLRGAGRATTFVIDASTAVALVDSGPDGRWAEAFLLSDLAAPHLVHVEMTNVLRRAAMTGEITEDTASLAHADLLALRIDLVPYDAVADRVWDLRHKLTAYDAWYVAVAQLLDDPLATLDQRLTSSPGPTCRFTTPAN